MTEHLNPQPAASSAVEQATWLEQFAVILREVPEIMGVKITDERRQALRDAADALRAESCPACAEKDQQIAELSRYKRAVDNHLCEHDKEDWLRCSYNHNKECAVCQHDVREHQWLERAERAEAEITRLARLQDALAEYLNIPTQSGQPQTAPHQDAGAPEGQ